MEGCRFGIVRTVQRLSRIGIEMKEAVGELGREVKKGGGDDKGEAGQ